RMPKGSDPSLIEHPRAGSSQRLGTTEGTRTISDRTRRTRRVQRRYWGEVAMMNQTQTWKLNDPGLSSLHRAGLAGLWMTLDSLTEEARKDRLDWPTWIEHPPELQPNSVRLTWEGTPRRLLEWLLPNAFRIDEGTGMIDLIGMRLPTLETRSAIHQAILGT